MRWLNSLALMAGLFVIFFAVPAFALPPAEELRVERFLQAIGQENNLVFIRNGREHSVSQAVSHLRRKLKSSKDKLQTAEEFIDNVASKSSISGKPYLIRRPGGSNEEAGPYFRQLLAEIESAPAPLP
jgi:hypothetical protein